MNFLDANGLEQLYMLTMAKIDNKIITAATSTSPKASGLSASIGEEVKFARGDHVHPPGYSNKLTENLILNLGTGRSEFNVGNPIYLTLNNIGAYDLANRGIEITSGEDLNNSKYLTPGNYYVSNSSSAINISHTPFTKNGYRLICQTGYGNGVESYGYQFAFGSNNNIKFRMYDKSANVNTWSAWDGYLRLTGGTLTGNLTIESSAQIGALKVPNITITDTEPGTTHIKFNRPSANYIVFPPNGSLSINCENAASTTDAASLLITDANLQPGVINKIDLGTDEKRWKDLYLSGNIDIANKVVLQYNETNECLDFIFK